jgi:16S rRNA (uracil1498-N3)-methyltransferase
MKEAIESAGAESVVLADPDGGPAMPGRSIAGSSHAIVVGPEGGFTDRERADLLTAGARPVSLGRRRLRAETAAIVLAAALATTAET